MFHVRSKFTVHFPQLKNNPPVKGVAKIARKLGFDFAEAVVRTIPHKRIFCV